MDKIDITRVDRQKHCLGIWKDMTSNIFHDVQETHIMKVNHESDLCVTEVGHISGRYKDRTIKVWFSCREAYDHKPSSYIIIPGYALDAMQEDPDFMYALFIIDGFEARFGRRRASVIHHVPGPELVEHIRFSGKPVLKKDLDAAFKFNSHMIGKLPRNEHGDTHIISYKEFTKCTDIYRLPLKDPPTLHPLYDK